MKDVAQIDSYVEEYGLSIDSYKITKRQTNPERKTDYVWISFVASNSDFTYQASYELEYVLYNDGWLLEDYDDISSNYRPNYGLSRETFGDEVMATLDYDSYEYSGTAEEGNAIEFYYHAETTEYYLTSVEQVCICYTFRPSDNWGKPDITTEEIRLTPDLIGTWRYTSYDMDLTIEVLSLEPIEGSNDDDYRMTFTYEFLNAVHEKRYGGTYRANFIQKEPITIELNHHFHHKGEPHEWGGQFELIREDGSVYTEKIRLYAGGLKELYSFDSRTGATDCGIVWSDAYGGSYYIVFFEKVSDDPTIPDDSTDDPVEEPVLDQLRLGMTQAEVYEVLGEPKDAENISEDEYCEYFDCTFFGVDGFLSVGYENSSVSYFFFFSQLNGDKSFAARLDEKMVNYFSRKFGKTYSVCSLDEEKCYLWQHEDSFLGIDISPYLVIFDLGWEASEWMEAVFDIS